jgi:Uma2 family endonuclease
MSATALTADPVKTSVPDYPLHRLSIRQYHQLAEHGVLTEDDDVELLQGWLVEKMTKSPRHDATISRLTRVLLPLLPAGWMLRVQSAITTQDSEPEPDLAVVQERPDDYATTHPGPADIGLVIEVADRSLNKDRRKAMIYATAGIPTYWVVNLNEDCIEVYDEVSTVDGRYVLQETLALTDPIGLRLDGQVAATMSVGQLFAPRG